MPTAANECRLIQRHGDQPDKVVLNHPRHVKAGLLEHISARGSPNPANMLRRESETLIRLRIGRAD